jgi:CRISPR-associated endonuclease/helicase Cas3
VKYGDFTRAKRGTGIDGANRFLDQFAERRGDRTWQTPITQNDWHTGETIHLLTSLSALLHDLGKASTAFQMRLRGELTEKNEYRHEWVSLRLWQAFVGDDDDATWLKRLANPTAEDDATWLNRLQRNGNDKLPFAQMSNAPLAKAIGWLVVTHHRLPLSEKVPDSLDCMNVDWNEKKDDRRHDNDSRGYWEFAHGLPVTDPEWRKRVARIAQRLQSAIPQPEDCFENPYVMHVARLCLMLADHHYSSQIINPKDQENSPLYANTTKDRKLNQPLENHLLGVAKYGAEIAHALPLLETELPRLPPRHRILKKRASETPFQWQNKAADMALSLRERAAEQGAFIVNMASTGCGKTLANARIMYALSDPALGMRCSFAMGLRTLTLQTGRAFRDLLGLGDDELAIRVGGSASRTLFEHYEQEAANQAEKMGSASTQSLWDADSHILFEGMIDVHPVLQKVMRNPSVNKLIAAPLLVCTIDHLTPATECQRGGHQIAPMLRLMSSDLVLDEPDDFDIADLPALTRLVHWAGLLGSRVLLSSATLPPALVQGLFEAYRAGRIEYQRNRGTRPSETSSPICCTWVDEFAVRHADCANAESFAQEHHQFVIQRAAQLGKADVRRKAGIVSLDLKSKSKDKDGMAKEFADQVVKNVCGLHNFHHSIDPHSGKKVSFGLVRMANIDPLFRVALALFAHTGWEEKGVQVHLCVYHAQFPLCIRSAIEHRLDQTLNRRQPDAVFDLPEIRQKINAHPEREGHIFIVLGSPVTEVGRDHDYDWALVEPSSMRSLIQLAGRVRRHRRESYALDKANIRVFFHNWKYFLNGKDDKKPVFLRPGFENQDFLLAEETKHDLRNLFQDVDDLKRIDSRPRILANPDLKPRQFLVDLEHARMEETKKKAARWWTESVQGALLTGVLPKLQPFREDEIKRVDLVLRPNEDGDDYALFLLLKEKNKRGQTTFVLVEKSLNQRVKDAEIRGKSHISVWGATDYMEALTQLAEDLDMPLAQCAERFGTVSLRESTNGWRFHPALGFIKAAG